jgi:uncharacterized protein (TIGR02265 family)
MTLTTARFVDPPWNAPLNASHVIAAIPPGATLAGMFFSAVLDAAKNRPLKLSQPPRERYLQFGFYPIAEFAPLLVAAAEQLHPDRSLREALRKLGRGAPAALCASTLGKVTLGSAEGVHAIVTAMVNTYSINLRPCRCAVVSSKATSMVVSLDDIPYFLDSHHVGVFEGTLKHAHVNGRVRIATRGYDSADLLLEWTA